MQAGPFAQTARLRCLLLLPMASYVAVACYWYFANPFKFTGDEPHYLAIAESMLGDGDVDLRNDYAQAGLHPYGQLVERPRGWYSVHGLGLPMILALPQRLGGVLGAKIALALLLGALPLAVYRVIQQTLASSGWSLALTLALTSGMPFLNASHQLYPDLLAGALVFWTAALVTRPGAAFPSRAELVLAAGGVALLPWLHLKLALPAALLAAGTAVLQPGKWPNRRAGSSAKAGNHRGEHGGDGRGAWSGSRAVTTLWPAAALAVSLTMLACYNQHAFGKLSGPYRPDDALVADPVKSTMVFLGLHWDQAQGMYLQQPLLLLGLVGLASWWRADRRAALWLGLLYLSLIVPNCLHPNWYGGGSFAGRFAWSSVLLWTFPVAHGARHLLSSSPRVTGILLAASVALQVYLASLWLIYESYLLPSSFHVVPWAYNGLLPRWRTYLPFFHNFSTYPLHLPNYLFLALGAALIVIGGIWSAGCRRQRRLAWAACLSLGGLGAHFLCNQWMPAGSEFAPLRFPAGEFPGSVGRDEGSGRSARQGDGYGYLTVGPYVYLPKGKYRVELAYRSEGNDAAAVGLWEMVIGSSLVGGGALQPAIDRGRLSVLIAIPRERLHQPLQLRTTYPGFGDLSIDELVIKRLPRR